VSIFFRQMNVALDVLFGNHPDDRHPISDLFYNSVTGRLVPRSTLQLEIDVAVCPYCLQEVGSNELSLFRGRCGTCFECPRCGGTLRAQSKVTKDRAQVHFTCNHCRWDSVAVGLCEERITDFYKKVFQAERHGALDREYDRLYKSLLDQQQALMLLSTAKRSRDRKVSEATTVLKSETLLCPNVPFLGDDDGTRFDSELPESTTKPSMEWPIRKQVVVRSALKCRDQYVLKPQKALNGLFEVNHSASLYLPRLLVASGVPQMIAGQPTLVLLFLVNVCPAPVTVHSIAVANQHRCVASFPAASLVLEGRSESDDDVYHSVLPKEGSYTRSVVQEGPVALLRLKVTPPEVAPLMSVSLRLDCTFPVGSDLKRLEYYACLRFSPAAPDLCTASSIA